MLLESLHSLSTSQKLAPEGWLPSPGYGVGTPAAGDVWGRSHQPLPTIRNPLRNPEGGEKSVLFRTVALRQGVCAQASAESIPSLHVLGGVGRDQTTEGPCPPSGRCSLSKGCTFKLTGPPSRDPSPWAKCRQGLPWGAQLGAGPWTQAHDKGGC